MTDGLEQPAHLSALITELGFAIEALQDTAGNASERHGLANDVREHLEMLANSTTLLVRLGLDPKSVTELSKNILGALDRTDFAKPLGEAFAADARKLLSMLTGDSPLVDLPGLMYRIFSQTERVAQHLGDFLVAAQGPQKSEALRKAREALTEMIANTERASLAGASGSEGWIEDMRALKNLLDERGSDTVPSDLVACARRFLAVAGVHDPRIDGVTEP